MQVKHGVVTGVLDANGELSDEAARHIHNVILTKAAILQYIEPIAQVLAEAGRSSAKAMGDDADYAIDKWVGVICGRAHEIIEEDRRKRAAATPAKPFKRVCARCGDDYDSACEDSRLCPRCRARSEAADPFKHGTVGHDGRNPLRELIEKG